MIDSDVITTPGVHYQGRNLQTLTLDPTLRAVQSDSQSVVDQSSLNSEHISPAVTSACQPPRCHCLSVSASVSVDHVHATPCTIDNDVPAAAAARLTDTWSSQLGDGPLCVSSACTWTVTTPSLAAPSRLSSVVTIISGGRAAVVTLFAVDTSRVRFPSCRLTAHRYAELTELCTASGR